MREVGGEENQPIVAEDGLFGTRPLVEHFNYFFNLAAQNFQLTFQSFHTILIGELMSLYSFILLVIMLKGQYAAKDLVDLTRSAGGFFLMDGLQKLYTVNKLGISYQHHQIDGVKILFTLKASGQVGLWVYRGVKAVA